MLSIVAFVDDTLIFHPNPEDVDDQLVVPGVQNFSYDTVIMSLDDLHPASKNKYRFRALAVGTTTINISGQNSNAPGEPTITEQVSVTVNPIPAPGPLHHYAPTVEPDVE